MTLPDDTKRKMVELYGQGLPILEIVSITGASYSSIRNTLIREGIYTGSGRSCDAVAPVADPEQKTVFNPKSRKWVITSALNNCEVDLEFLEELKDYCKKHDAQLVIIPVRYKNLSLFEKNSSPIWPEVLNPYYLTEDIQLNKNLKIMGSFRIQATSSRPLVGLPGVAKGSSAVFGHPRIAMESVPTSLDEIPPMYATTGSISLPSYSETKAGRLGEFHHSMSAFIVETYGDLFWWRHISKGGQDLTQKEDVHALVLGDVHVGFHDDEVCEALLQRLSPSTVVLHDVLDFFADNHHHVGKPLLQAMKHQRGKDDVTEEFDAVGDWFNRYLSDTTDIVVVESNHHSHLDRWLDCRSDHVLPHNRYIWHRLNAMRFEHALNELDEDDWHPPSAFQLALKTILPDWRLSFSDSRTPYLIGNIDVSQHGDRGPNGARGSRGSFARTQRKTVVMHSHSYGITDGCYQGGMSCRKNMPYVSGYSSWMHVSCVIYTNGHRTLVPVVAGAYCLDDYLQHIER